MDVESLAKIGGRHGGAFDMPARTAAAPRAVPARLFRRRQLPQHEIAGVLLVHIDGDAHTGLLLVERALGEVAVVGHRLGVEQHLAARLIGMTAFDQALDQRDHVDLAIVARLDEFGGARLVCRLQGAECDDIGMELVGRLFRHAADRLVERQRAVRDLRAKIAQRPRVDLVVDVGDVARIGDVVFAIDMAQQPEQHVEDDHRARVADMGEVIDRRAADIHAHIVWIDGRKSTLRARERVVQRQDRLFGHGSLPKMQKPGWPGRLSSRDFGGRKRPGQRVR